MDKEKEPQEIVDENPPDLGVHVSETIDLEELLS
jgi:hypothetical protein